MASESESGELFAVFILLVFILLGGLIAYILFNTRQEQKKNFVNAEDYIRGVNESAYENNFYNFPLEEMEEQLKKEYASTCVIPPEADGTCREGTSKNQTSGCCELNDPEKMSKLEKGLKMTETIVESILIAFMFEKFVSYANRLTGFTARASYSKATKSAARVAARSTSRMAVRTALKTGAKIAAKPVAWVGGPLSFLWLAFEAWSMYLDIKDPRGYTRLYQPADLVVKIRRNITVAMEKKLNETTDEKLRMDFPQCFPLSLAYPEYDEEFQIQYFSKFLPSALQAVDDDVVLAFFTQILLNDQEADEESTEATIEAISDAMETITSTNYMERDEFIYNFYKTRVGPNLVIHSRSMSSPRRIGVTLSQSGARAFNTRKQADHVRYSDLSVDNDNENPSIPESYSPYVAVYTNKYEQLDTSLASFENYDNENPPVKEVVLPEYTTLMMPYGAIVSACIKGAIEKNGEIIRPGLYGVTYNYDRSDCNYTGEYCERFGLQYDSGKNECKMYPGQSQAELIFGTTVTRDFIRAGNYFGGFFEGLATGKGGL